MRLLSISRSPCWRCSCSNGPECGGSAGLGTILGLIILRTGNAVVGETLVLAGCVFMFLGGIIMGVADALGFYPHMGDSVRGDIGASLPPLIALVASLI